MTVKDTVKDTAERATAFAADTLAGANDKLHDAGGALRDSASAAREKAAGAFEATKEKSGAAFDAAREKASAAAEITRERAAAAAEAAREKASAAYASARETASNARYRAADGIDESPIAALVGGIAIGVLLGALLPRSRREIETLAPLGDRLGTLARNALVAAKEAGQDKLDELGINKEAAREKVDRLIDGAGQAATSAGSAAAGAIRS